MQTFVPTGKYAVISCDVLPEVFLKVIEVKRLLATGEEKSSASACKRAEISRSAYYKYRDSVFTYEEKMQDRIVSLHAVLRDTPGVLSAMLACLHKNGANIVSLNQNAAVDGAAAVTVTVKLPGGLNGGSLNGEVGRIEGVVETRLIF
ncbi:MAG: ACT domain-containing protein [Ruminococcus sp.]|nr:ACT domain-containing protein [Ruminococcus sp.]